MPERACVEQCQRLNGVLGEKFIGVTSFRGSLPDQSALGGGDMREQGMDKDPEKNEAAPSAVDADEAPAKRRRTAWAWIIVGVMIVAVAGLLASSALGVGPRPLVNALSGKKSQGSAQAARSEAEKKAPQKAKKSEGTKKARRAKEKGVAQSTMRTPIDWHLSSETVPYPNLAQVSDLWIRTVISKHRTYVMSGDKTIYTMYSSAGKMHKDDSGKMVSYTPTGTYAVQNERGTHFYNAEAGEGANWWVSWKDHGSYLFHSVPVDEHGNYIVPEAEKLGKQTASHGCIRLSIADAKWFYDQLPVGTKVVIEQ